MSKTKWKYIAKEAVNKQNKLHLLEQSKSYKKLSFQKLSSEDYGLKSYIRTMNMSSARVFFAARAQMLVTVQHNYKNKPEYVANQWLCQCGEPDLQAHLETCSSYLHLQQGLDLKVDIDLVKFYQLVIKERTENQANQTNRGHNQQEP